MTTSKKSFYKPLVPLILFFIVMILIGAYYSETPLSDQRFAQIQNYAIAGTSEANPNEVLFTMKEAVELLKQGGEALGFKPEVSVLGNFMRVVIRTDSIDQSVRYVLNCGMETCKVSSGSILLRSSGKNRPLLQAEALSGLNSELKSAGQKDSLLPSPVS